MIGKICKTFLLIVTILNIIMNTRAYTNMPIRMSLRNDVTNKTGKRHTIVDEMLKTSKICHRKSIAVDTIILNTYKINKFYINSNSPTITLSLKDEMKNIYYINDLGETEKLLNTTAIIPNILRNLFVYELDVDMDVDCIMYKS